jgi:hypothetical protein
MALSLPAPASIYSAVIGPPACTARVIGNGLWVVQRGWAAKNPRATFKTPITFEDVLNSPMIAYPFRKWPAASAAVPLRNKPEKLPYSRGMCGP